MLLYPERLELVFGFEIIGGLNGVLRSDSF